MTDREESPDPGAGTRDECDEHDHDDEPPSD
jgi:hypothetical protein